MFNKYINEFKMQKIDFIYKKRFQYIYIISNSIFITTKLIKTLKKKFKSSEIHNQTRFYTNLPFTLTKSINLIPKSSNLLKNHTNLT